MTKMLIAAVALAALAHPANAATVNVRFGDLDLRTVAGQAALDRRIDAAARAVCSVKGERELSRLMAADRCYRTALASTRSQVATLIARAKRAA